MSLGQLSRSASASALVAVAPLGLAGTALANDKLGELAKSDDNRVMPGKNYEPKNLSDLTQIDKSNVKQLRPAWTISTGLFNGHEGAPLVVDGEMYVHTSFPNYTLALDLDDRGHILWQDKPKQNPAAGSVACCDLVNRGLAYRTTFVMAH